MSLAQIQTRLAAHAMQDWGQGLASHLQHYYSQVRHGDLPGWQQSLDKLPTITPAVIKLDCDRVQIGSDTDCSDTDRQHLQQVLSLLMPWRKGPFALFGLQLDAEWRSDLKWARLQDRITPLDGRCVLDVGCGNGYFSWRMLGAGADLVIGLEPVLRYVMQFRLIKHFLPEQRVELLPFRLDELGDEQLQFDTVFSMGVLYHHPDPALHLRQLHDSLRPGGELVLESLIVDQTYAAELRPANSYACMKNISIIPSVDTLTDWLGTAGYRTIELLDVTATDPQEQRVTAWSGDRSLADFLDPNDNSLTVEGYPAPLRALLTAKK
ncbi:MAG: tRNA 5-methoxyuridine(34)/uridine 5-oxyacetic acid(34) synthase CmoB [Gammaproteobacteria bacterium]